MAESTLCKTALTKAMTLCSKRELCCDDIRQKLLSWGINDDDSDKIIDTLRNENFLNESRYAAAFTRDKFKYNKWGKLKIAAHLKAKNIPKDIVRSSLDSIDNETYLRLLRELIANHRKSVKGKNRYDLKAKLMRYGLSKGFESNLLYDILNDLDD
jgi:regulatory protein